MTINIRLEGGLGNQMFQYAFGRAVSQELNEPLCLDLSFLLKRNLGARYKSALKSKHNFTYRDFYLDIFNLNDCNFIYDERLYYKYALKIGNRIGCDFPWVVTEKNFKGPKSNSTYVGLWQSREFFHQVEESLRKEFIFKASILSASQNYLNLIENLNSVCVNVRRTDFVGCKLHDICDISYYKTAFNKIEQAIDNPTYFIFSDDIEWCIKNLQFNKPHYFIDHTHAHSSENLNFDNYLNLMSRCKNFIIPNSTFAWWAVWLSNLTEGIIISPSKWLTTDSNGASRLIDKRWVLI